MKVLSLYDGMSCFIETKLINQISFLVVAVGYGFVSGIAFNGDMD